jgi:Mycolic acid cyclopropane synthetase
MSALRIESKHLDFEMEEGSLTEFLTVLVRNRLDRRLAEALNLSLAGRLLWIRFTNRLRGRRGNIATHYDKEDDSLFETFLDPRLVYSCGFVTDPQAGIEQFQLDKLTIWASTLKAFRINVRCTQPV